MTIDESFEAAVSSAAPELGRPTREEIRDRLDFMRRLAKVLWGPIAEIDVWVQGSGFGTQTWTLSAWAFTEGVAVSVSDAPNSLSILLLPDDARSLEVKYERGQNEETLSVTAQTRNARVLNMQARHPGRCEQLERLIPYLIGSKPHSNIIPKPDKETKADR